ncbi:MAG: hypothetical protein L6243_00335 [Candidatus Altiarchaeales archaeon]|nr:hypothetical protein [Candidatus Altiarchaeota archaeon]MBU4341997.1 hypothetical protein [Candidatus Altiarchaeota archaeon]MBU4406565.1 hypothetical protein [Candidatus Altiarchaeota archaeon]MCG2782015.1 hypothetical protein [Candidatus Altiarchaeales archaeon]
MANVFMHSPTLESVLMVEKAAKEYSGELGKYQLWKRLPRKMMYQTFQAVLSYLLESNKIIIDREGKVVWIWDPEGVRRILQKGLITR